MTLSAAALLSELLTDPKSLHYSGTSVEAIVNLLNTPGLSNETCPNSAVSMADVLIAVDIGELKALDQRTWEYLQIVAQQPTVDLTNPYVIGKLEQIFPAEGVTVASVNTLRTRPCSRYEALSGAGAVATAVDVTAAIATNGGIGP